MLVTWASIIRKAYRVTPRLLMASTGFMGTLSRFGIWHPIPPSQLGKRTHEILNNIKEKIAL